MSDSKGHNPYNTYPNNQFDNSPPPYSANPAVPQLYPAYPASHPNSYPSAMQSNPYPQTQANPYPTPPTQQPSYPPTTQPNPYSFAQSAQHPMATKASAFFGPYLKYGNVDINAWLWYGSVLIITTSTTPCILTLSPNPPPTPDAVKPYCVRSVPIDTFLGHTFHRFDICIPMGPVPVVWSYSIDVDPSQIFNFHVAAANDKEWKFAFFSCNGFSTSVSPEERAKLGGVGALWNDVLNVHKKPGNAFHVMLGGGDQIYGDPIWKEIPSLAAWLHIKGKENRRNAPWTPQLEHEVSYFYFNLYSTHFATPVLREALASIPSVFQIDDHDIFDGYGSYPEYIQHSHVFQNIGRIAMRFYLLFQQHTTCALAASGGPHAGEFISPNSETFHYVKLLGPSVALVGPDTRSERTRAQILSPRSWDLIFDTLSAYPPTIKHIILMLAVPVVYPRLKMPETLLTQFGTAKSAANKAVNGLGKGVASAVGGAGKFLGKVGVKVDADKWEHQAQGAVDDVLGSMKKGLGKSGLMSGVISQFGEVDLLDDMIDHWTHPVHEAERTYLITRLQQHAHQFRRRVTFISGDVHCAGVGRLYNPAAPQDAALMYQIIASAIVNIPPPKGVLKMLHTSAKVIDFGNGVKEEMLDLFTVDVDGKGLADKKLIGRRNWGMGCVEADVLEFGIRVEGVQGVGACCGYGPVKVPPM